MSTIKTPQAGSNYSLAAIYPSTPQVLAFDDTSAQSAVLGSTVVRLCATEDCWVLFGANPTAADTTSIFLPAGVVEYFGCAATDKIAAIQNTEAGSLSITPAQEVS